jgi:hypothetical protein
MSAILSISLERKLQQVLDQEELVHCRFCQCTEFTPCGIPVTEDRDGRVRLARGQEETDNVLPCSWYIDGVCNGPACIEKLLAEWRGEEPEVLLFDATGRKLSPLRLDLDADFVLIGRELGIRQEELSREAVIERIRELRRRAGDLVA